MRLRSIFMASAFLLLAFSCETPEKPDEVKPEIQVPSESQKVFASGINFGENAGSSSQISKVSFIATDAWATDVTETKASSWLSVQPSSGGAGTVVMTVTAQPNSGETARSATVTIRCGIVSKSFSVMQAGNSPTVVAVESVTLDKTDLSLEEGQSQTLIATVHPDNATDKTVAWSSSNTDVATVDQNGRVTAVSPGSATVTATAGEKSASCKVTSQGRNPVKDLAIIQAAEDNSVVDFEALVCATGSRGFVVTDGKAFLLVYTTDVPCCVGDMVRINGVKTTYRDMPEISETGLTCDVLSSGNPLPTIDFPDITSTLDSFSSTYATPVMVKGKVLGTDLIVEGADHRVFLYWPNEALSAASFDGKTVVVKGIFLFSINNYRDIMPVSIEEVDQPIPITASKYLTFTSTGSTVLSLVGVGENAPVLYYSKDKTHWTRWDYSGLSFSSKTPLYICGDNPKGFSTSWQDYSYFSATGDAFSVSGDVMSLLDREKDLSVIPCEDCFSYLFFYCHLLRTPPSLPASSLTLRCYRAMFYGCDGMTSAPALPATELAEACYYDMFTKCYSLVSAPVLPATKMVRYCYWFMFSECTALTEAPALPATTLATGCYDTMFSGCSSLRVAPDLPALTLEQHCYARMFRGCSSLTSAPALPAIEMEIDCYGDMFKDCTSLTKAPELPAAILSVSCYEGMFQGCSKLSHVICLATDISAPSCVDNWLDGVAETGTFVKSKKMNDWPRGGSGIPIGWNVVNYGADGPSGGDEDDKYSGGNEGTTEEDWR